MKDVELSSADNLHAGDTVTVRFRVSGPNAINKLPELKATILSVEGDLVRVRYADGCAVVSWCGRAGQIASQGKPVELCLQLTLTNYN
jgi:hypothetical protein